jgi:hypothetical protein
MVIVEPGSFMLAFCLNVGREAMEGLTRRAAIGCLLGALAAFGCGDDKDAKFRAQVLPVVAKVTERVKVIAAVTAAPVPQALDLTDTYLTDLAGLSADLKALEPQNEKQKSYVSAGLAYLGATHRFILAQEEFAKARGRLDVARAKVKESLDGRQRASQFTMDFWKETHERLLGELEKVRKDATHAREKLAVSTTTLKQSAEASSSVLGGDVIVGGDVLEAHRTALEAIPLAN